jgi:rare lipoprotein A
LSKAKDIKINTKMRILFFVMFSIFTFGQDQPVDSLKIQNSKNIGSEELLTTVKQDSIIIDTLTKSKLYKKNVVASYYAKKFNGRKTASGMIFSNDKLTAAHKKLPFGTKLLITNEKNGKSIVVTVNDRGPFSKGKEIDLSYKAFLAICNHKNEGLLRVNIEIVE